MIQLSEEDMSKAEIGQKLGFLHHAISQVVNVKNTFLKEKSYLSEHTDDEWSRLTAYAERALEVCLEDWTSYSIPVSQSLIQSMALTFLTFVKAKRGDEEKKNWKLADICS